MRMPKTTITGEKKRNSINVSILSLSVHLKLSGALVFVVKTKYGEEALNLGSDDSSSSSEDDEIGGEFTEEVEKQFFKTLSCLKSKDPSIYNKDVKFFDKNATKLTNTKKGKKEQPMYLKDYERNLILEKGGQISDSDNEISAPR